MTFEEFGEECRALLRKDMRRVSKPEADIDASYFLIQSGEDAVTQACFPMKGFYQNRHMMTDLIAVLISRMHPEFLGAQMTAWTVPEEVVKEQHATLTEEEQEDYRKHGNVPDWMMPSKSPQRIEIVQLLLLSADANECWWSAITRHPKLRPRYGEWQHVLAGYDMTGAMYTPLRQAMSWPDLSE